MDSIHEVRPQIRSAAGYCISPGGRQGGLSRIPGRNYVQIKDQVSFARDISLTRFVHELQTGDLHSHGDVRVDLH